MYTRRQFGRLALAGLPAAALIGRDDAIFAAFSQAKPNSMVNGVQLGVITYSYRSLPDQSAEATLKYVVQSGINAIELMGGPVESFAGAPAAPSSGRGGRGGGRGPQGGAAAPATPPATATASWNGQPCEPTKPGPPPPAGRGGRGRAQMSPEQQEHATKLRVWRPRCPMSRRSRRAQAA